MSLSRRADLWAKPGPVLNAWLSTGSAFVAEILAAQGFGSLTIDLQHGLGGEDCLAPALQSIRASGVTPIARVPGLDLPAINRALDLGAMAIICPMVDTADEARELVSAVRYPPAGRRSFGPTRAAIVHGAGYAHAANDRIACLAMIETSRAVQNLHEIVAVPGLDGIYIGPSDLTMSLANGALEPGFDREEAELVTAILDIAGAAHRAGKRVGLHCGSAAYAARAIRSGFDLVTLPNDVRLLASSAAAAVERVTTLARDATPLGGEIRLAH